MEALFTQALGLHLSWRVVSVDFRQAEGLIVFEIDNTAQRLACPACGAADQPIHDRLARSWLKDSAHWTVDQITKMHWLQRSGLKTVRAWRLKQRLREVFARCTDPQRPAPCSHAGSRWATRCRLPPFKRLAGTMKKNLAGILEHFRSGLNNGFAEAINGRLQAAKARAKGYGTDAHLITISYLVCAKLKHLPKNPWTTAAQPMVA